MPPYFLLSQTLIDGAIGAPGSHSFTLSTADGMKMVFHGNFTVAGGAITGGTVKGFDLFFGSTKVMKAAGASIDYAAVAAAISDAQGGPGTQSFFELFASSAKLKGSSDDDYLQGVNSTKILGKAGNDYLDAGMTSGKTKIDGGDSDDILVGNGLSKMKGGEGDDIFVFYDNLTTTADAIKDFDVKHDVIALYPFVFDNTPVGYLDDAYFHVGKAAKTADHHVIYDKKTGALYWDEDGSGAMAQVKLASLDKHLKMHADNIFVADFV
ncbi:MAG: hypothetical protein KDK07_17230 [Bauldia sp.]|nr:hypothetical protein [Bauldia sp.]